MGIRSWWIPRNPRSPFYPGFFQHPCQEALTPQSPKHHPASRLQIKRSEATSSGYYHAQSAEGNVSFKSKCCGVISSQIISKMETSLIFSRAERDSGWALPVFILRPAITFHLSSPLDLNGSSRCVEGGFTAANHAASALPCPAAPTARLKAVGSSCAHIYGLVKQINYRDW